MRKEILRARKISRTDLLDKGNSEGNASKLTISVKKKKKNGIDLTANFVELRVSQIKKKNTCIHKYMFQHLKSKSKELHVILAGDEDQKRLFPEVPIIGFKNNKNFLITCESRTALPCINEVGRCKPRGGKRPLCQLCSNLKNTSAFKSKHSNEVYQINKYFI